MSQNRIKLRRTDRTIKYFPNLNWTSQKLTCSNFVTKIQSEQLLRKRILIPLTNFLLNVLRGFQKKTCRNVHMVLFFSDFQNSKHKFDAHSGLQTHFFLIWYWFCWSRNLNYACLYFIFVLWNLKTTTKRSYKVVKTIPPRKNISLPLTSCAWRTPSW